MRKEKELLRKQMELLAEQSKSAIDDELVRLSTAMCETYRELKCPIPMSIAFFSAVSLNLLISILVLVEKFFRCHP